MLYSLLPQDPHVAPFARSYSTAGRARAQAQRITLCAPPDVARRMRASAGLTLAAGLLSRAGKESGR